MTLASLLGALSKSGFAAELTPQTTELNTMNIRSRKLATVLSLVMGAGAGSTVVAQTTPGKPTDEKVTLEKFVVTGSLIPIAAGSPAIPVKLINAVELERSGLELAELLRRHGVDPELGRICLHLVERPEETLRPFAFLATLARSRLSAARARAATGRLIIM